MESSWPGIDDWSNEEWTTPPRGKCRREFASLVNPAAESFFIDAARGKLYDQVNVPAFHYTAKIFLMSRVYELRHDIMKKLLISLNIAE